MKRTHKIAAAVVAVVCAACAALGTLAACKKSADTENDGKGQAGQSNANTVVSYVSQNSSVYSSTSEVVEAIADTVVEISTESVTTQWGMQYVVSGAGSGVVVGRSGETYYIVTNNHVIDGANNITVRLRDGDEFTAAMVASDDSQDIAVVTISCGYDLKIAVWGDSDSLKIGEDLIAIGNPLGSLGGTVTKGILSAKGRSITVGDYAMTLLQTDTAINPGNSGGGLFNMRGELIGVVNAKTTDEEIEGICFAIPANTARAVYESLTEHGYLLGRAALPVEIAVGNLSQSQSVVYVTSVGDAAEGTFKKYDRIFSINGREISSKADYNAALAAVKAGDTLNICVYRGSVSQGMWGSSSISFASEPTEFTFVAAQ